ncbi:thioredoxin family protein [Pararcticibacter amylolyticus]|uniref:Thioredoxin domain-containing protein n=1 Tax=Pararcticibacter amylolyticus TaxID=2173175 RepID=A0A2U2PG43_9SPHI|nr:thioredoxin fold domain-containing protein [Pararcticibacter amylolyticus]PWG80330.1 hypothetical protein DDR33_12005 [Pararcticibacter amylolyticus]
MPKFFIILIVSLSSAFITKAQDKGGIQFLHGLSWDQVKEKAKSENKYIFLDGFTTWCAPCRAMEKNVLSQKATGDFFNSRFLNIKVQFDVTKADNNEVKNWYKDAEAIQKDYLVNSYPTYLFFNPNGELVHRIAGGSPTPEEFITMAKDALNPGSQYYMLKKQYESGVKRDPEFLRSFIRAAEVAHENKAIPDIVNDYLITQTDQLTDENLRIISIGTSKTSDRGFNILKNNRAKADAVLGVGKSGEIIRGVLTDEIVVPFLRNGGHVERHGPMLMYTGEINNNPDWKVLKEKLDKQYPEFSDEVTMAAMPLYCQFKNDWPKYAEYAASFINKYGHRLSGDTLNSYAWDILINLNDEKCLETATAWSKLSLSGRNEKNPGFLFTYASLLYKSGKREDAISVQKDLVKLSNKNEGYLQVLNKMEKGEKVF